MKFLHAGDVHLGAVPESGTGLGILRSREIWDAFRDIIEISSDTNQVRKSNGLKMTSSEKKQLIEQLEAKMRKAAKMLEYEIAAQLRDEIIRLRGEK